MDTSETYIKMCEKAEEIQKLAPNPLYSSHDWFVERIRGNVPVWLPRQDQLQETVHPSDCTYAISYCLLDNFIDWYQSRCYDELARVYSMEQLWLAFVMKEKHNKGWNGSEWVIKGNG